MARIGTHEITHHILRLGGGNGGKVILEDGGDIWLIEPNAADPVGVYKVVLEQLARQGYRIVELGQHYTTLQLENDKAATDAGPTVGFQLERVETPSAAENSDAAFLASHGLIGLSPDQVAQTMALLQAEQTIQLIKWLRTVRPELGLKEAKELGERLRDARGIRQNSASGCGAAVLVPFILGGVGAALSHFFGALNNF